jgi:carbon-monoxide dehydrogenase small subunit
MRSKIKINFKINGREVKIAVAPNKRLIDLIRCDLNLTGTKEGCSIGECGACTVLLDGEAVNSCLILAPKIHNKEVLTIEGLEHDRLMTILIQSFIEKGAVQCGFCTPGMILSVYALLNKKLNPTTGEIREAIAGNLCRCTGYKQIIDAVRYAAYSKMKR